MESLKDIIIFLRVLSRARVVYGRELLRRFTFKVLALNTVGAA